MLGGCQAQTRRAEFDGEEKAMTLTVGRLISLDRLVAMKL
jgi:hypothetical protein